MSSCAPRPPFDLGAGEAEDGSSRPPRPPNGHGRRRPSQGPWEEDDEQHDAAAKPRRPGDENLELTDIYPAGTGRRQEQKNLEGLTDIHPASASARGTGRRQEEKRRSNSQVQGAKVAFDSFAQGADYLGRWVDDDAQKFVEKKVEAMAASSASVEHIVRLTLRALRPPPLVPRNARPCVTDSKKLGAAMKAAGRSCTREQAMALMERYDTTGDGLIDRNEFEFILEHEVDICRAAQLAVLQKVREKVGLFSDIFMGYVALLKYLSIVLVFCIVLMQQNSYSGMSSSIITSIENSLYDASTQTVDGLGAITDHFSDVPQILSFLHAMVDNMFADRGCGDGRCDTPEEYPSWFPADDARSFDPCMVDCGALSTVSSLTTVRINFFDIEKLRAAYKTWIVYSEIAQSFAGGTPAEWGVGDSTPLAGWNVCSRDRAEYGFLDTVCVFDASVTIDGLPYRTNELDYDDVAFGQWLDVDLFDGNWEIRIAYSNWSISSNGIFLWQFAHPAVRGSLHYRLSAGTFSEAQVWAPCPNAGDCRANWVRGMYHENCAVMSCDWSWYDADQVPDWQDADNCYLCSTYTSPTEIAPEWITSEPHGLSNAFLFNTVAGAKYNGTSIMCFPRTNPV